jgi:hypothetical protein
VLLLGVPQFWEVARERLVKFGLAEHMAGGELSQAYQSVFGEHQIRIFSRSDASTHLCWVALETEGRAQMSSFLSSVEVELGDAVLLALSHHGFNQAFRDTAPAPSRLCEHVDDARHGATEIRPGGSPIEQHGARARDRVNSLACEPPDVSSSLDSRLYPGGIESTPWRVRFSVAAVRYDPFNVAGLYTSH